MRGMSALTLYSTNPIISVDRAKYESERQTQRATAWSVIDTLRSDPPGFWTDNKYEESNHDRGVTYIAIRAIMDALHCATVTVGRRKQNRGKSILALGSKLSKSVTSSNQSNSSSDEAYQPVTDHPICRLIEKPNPVDTCGQILSYLALQNRLTGTAPLWTLPNQSGRPVEIYALPTALTTPLWQRTPEFPRGAWRVQPFYASGGLGYLPSPYSGTGVIVPNGEIQRFMDPHPLFRHDGKSPQAACAFQMDVLEEIDNARWAAFDHGVTMDAVLQVEGFDDAQIRRLEARMEEKHQGTRNHRRFLIISGQGGQTERTKIQSFSNSPREMDFNQSWEQMVGFVLAVFGVPKSVAGLSNATNYSELYAAIQQFYHRQGAFVHRMAEFLTKALAWPYCRFPGEYRVNIDLPPIMDKELQDKQLNQDAQNGTILYNEYRKARNRPTVPDGDVPVSVYLKLIEQKLAPDPTPAAPPGMEAPAGAEDEQPQGEQPPDEQTVMDDVTREAFEKLGVPWTDDDEQGQEQDEAAPVDEMLKAMPAAKPMPKSGVYTDKRGRKYRIEGGKRVPIGETKPAPTMPSAAHVTKEQTKVPRQPKVAQPAPTAPGEHTRAPKPGFRSAASHATATPEGRAIIERAKVWAGRQAEKHADKVAAHLGITRDSAIFLLRTTIEHLCREALATAAPASKTYESPEGKKLTVGIRKKQKGTGPSSGAVKHPENPAAFGSRPPLAPKSMSAFQSGLGAELIAPASNGGVVILKRPRSSKKRRVKYLERLVKGLPT